MNKKGGIIIFLLLVLIFSFSGVYASCPNGDSQLIMKISSSTNAHGELYNGTSYSVGVCYDEIFGSKYTGSNQNQCKGANKILGLSATTNAHSEIPSSNNYSIDVCYGDLTCRSATSCTANEKCVVALSDISNAHLENCSQSNYLIKICCNISETTNVPPTILDIIPKDRGIYFLQENLTFNQTSVDSDGSIQEVIWEFGENVNIEGVGNKNSLNLTGSQIQNSYKVSFSNAGQKNIKLSVKDDDGAVTKGQISILIISSPYTLAYISSPQPETTYTTDDGKINISAEGIFVVNTEGIYNTPNFKVVCLAGDCTTTAGEVIKYNVENTPQTLSTDKLNFKWTLHKSKGAEKIINKKGNQQSAINFREFFYPGQSWIELVLNYTNGTTSAVSYVRNNFFTEFSSGACDPDGDFIKPDGTIDSSVDCVLAYWANVVDEQIYETSQKDIEPESTRVWMVLENTELPNGTILNFEIYEEDDSLFDFLDDEIGDDKIRVDENNITGIVDENGDAIAKWTLSYEDLEKAGDENGYLFYFKVSDKESGRLIATILSPNYCSGVLSCGDYENQQECGEDNCDIAVDWIEENIGIQCSGGVNCKCSWNGSFCKTSYIVPDDNPPFNLTSYGSLGECIFNEDTTDDCTDGYITYSWKSLINWPADNAGWGSNPDEEKAILFSKSFDESFDDMWHYDPINSLSNERLLFDNCRAGENSAPCPSRIQVPFFGVYNFIIAFCFIALIYIILIFRNKK